MRIVSTETLLIILCALVVVSYLFSILSQYIRIPSVLLLLFGGLAVRAFADYNNLFVPIPEALVEGLGVVGLIMIVLEAGLDLKITKQKYTLVRDSFLAALIILVFSTAIIAAILHYWLQESLTSSIVYALPLSIMSSSIVLPSIHHLTTQKKEFLIYEASFSDILGIVLFNYFTAREIFTFKSFGVFGLNIFLAILLSVIISFLLFLLLTKSRMNIKFFLVFALLILIYSGGKILHLPSLLIILVFGLMINNWESLPAVGFLKKFSPQQTETVREFLHSITAESSFLIRTFFFLLFGYSIDLSMLNNNEVIWIGTLIVLSLFLVRLVYLRFFFRTAVFPEVFFIPRGLITIVLFYKIPEHLKLTYFNDGILFFIILSTGVILSGGMIFYKKQSDEVVEDPQFSDRKEIL